MAQLKSTVVQGNLSVTDTTYTTNLNLASATASKAILTDANKNLVSGTVPVNTGGTGGTSFTANSVIMSGSSTTAAFTTRAITNNTSATAVTASTNLITANTLYYHIGNSNITTLGTITTGTWSATVINPNKGGTGVNSYAKGDILYAGAAIANTATTALSKLTIGSSGQVLQTTSSGIPGWITATDANTASTIVKRDSSGNFSAGTITAALSGNADSATVLYTGAPTSSTSGDIVGAIQTYWNANKSTIIRNKGLAFCSTHSTVSMSFGYFLSGYDSTPYGGFFSALYNTPYYIGVNNGTFTQQTILTSTNYTTYCTPANIDAATSDHNHDSVYLKLSGGTMTGVLTLKGEQYSDNYALNANNSNIIGINQLRFNDAAETYNEGIMFPNGTGYDCMAANGGTFHFRSATDGTPTVSLANSIAGIACGTINSGSVIIKQPSTARNQGIFGTYDYSRAAVIWGMGTGYNIAADGSGLGSFYGAAYGYQGQAYLGSNNYAGGHQFLWCQNGAVYVALGSTIWTSTQVIAGTFAANTAQTAEADITAQSGAGKIYLYSTAATTGNRGIWALNAAGNSASIMVLDQSNNTIFSQNVYYDSGQIVIRHGTSPMSRILFGTRAQTNTYTMASQNEWGDIFYFAPAKNNSDNTWFNAGFIFRQYSYTASSTTRLSYYEDYYFPRVTTGLSSSPTYNVLTSKGFVGINSSWNTARNNAQLRMTAIYTGGYSPILSVKTTAGSWEMGEYDNTNWANALLFTYVTDTQYSTSGANYTAQLRLSPTGYAIYTRGGETAYQAYNSTSGVNVSLMAGNSGLGGLYVNGYSTTGASGTFTSNAGWIIARDNQNHNSIYGTVALRSNATASIYHAKGTSQTKVNGYAGFVWDSPGSGDLYYNIRWRALNYSYNSSTKARLDAYEYFDLPAVTANLSVSAAYNILTTKNGGPMCGSLFIVLKWSAANVKVPGNGKLQLNKQHFSYGSSDKVSTTDFAGYKAISLIRLATGSKNIVPFNIWISHLDNNFGASSSVLGLRNLTSSEITVTPSLYILYIKSDTYIQNYDATGGNDDT